MSWFDEEFKQIMTSKDLSTVIICGHMNPDGDACGSVMGLAHYISCAYPEYKVLPYLADNMDKGPKKYAMNDNKFNPFKKPVHEGDSEEKHPDRFLLIICDTAYLSRLSGREYYGVAEAVGATIVIDHHLANERYGMFNHTEISEACAHNVYNALDKEKLFEAAKEPHPNAADYLYMGMIHDTNCFERADVELLECATNLLRMGVNHREIVQTKKWKTLQDKEKERWLLSQTKRGCSNPEVAYIYVDHATATKKKIGYEDIHPIADALRDCADIEMAFFMYEERPSLWRCSFRSNGIIYNVNDMMTEFGGGGHAGAASIRIETQNPKLLLKQFINAAEKARKR